MRKYQVTIDLEFVGTPDAEQVHEFTLQMLRNDGVHMQAHGALPNIYSVLEVAQKVAS